jgi:hypothetical protein
VLLQKPFHCSGYPETVHVPIGREAAHIGDRNWVGRYPCHKNNSVAFETMAHAILCLKRKADSFLSNIYWIDAIDDRWFIGTLDVRRVSLNTSRFRRDT